MVVIICIDNAGRWVTRPPAQHHRLLHGVSTLYCIDQVLPTKLMEMYAHISQGWVVHELPHRRHVAGLHAIHLRGLNISNSKALKVHKGILPCY